MQAGTSGYVLSSAWRDFLAESRKPLRWREHSLAAKVNRNHIRVQVGRRSRVWQYPASGAIAKIEILEGSGEWRPIES